MLVVIRVLGMWSLCPGNSQPLQRVWVDKYEGNQQNKSEKNHLGMGRY